MYFRCNYDHLFLQIIQNDVEPKPLRRFRQNKLSLTRNYTLYNQHFFNFQDTPQKIFRERLCIFTVTMIIYFYKLFKMTSSINHCVDFAKINCHLLVIINSITDTFLIFKIPLRKLFVKKSTL